MDKQGTMKINLVLGESRQLLVDPGCTLLVMAGRVLVSSPFGWLAEQIHQRSAVLDAEAVMLIESGGWIEFEARLACQVILIPPQSASLWSRLGSCLEKWLADRQLDAENRHAG